MTALGNCELAWPCRICARIWSVFGSVLTSKSTVSFIEPLLALSEYMYSMLSTPDICCSMGTATDCWTVRASAPGYVAFTWICGSAMLGNCATGRRDIATTPMSTMRMEITMATMGRLMKNLAIAQELRNAECGMRTGPKADKAWRVMVFVLRLGLREPQRVFDRGAPD